MDDTECAFHWTIPKCRRGSGDLGARVQPTTIGMMFTNCFLPSRMKLMFILFKLVFAVVWSGIGVSNAREMWTMLVHAIAMPLAKMQCISVKWMMVESMGNGFSCDLQSCTLQTVERRLPYWCSCRCSSWTFSSMCPTTKCCTWHTVRLRVFASMPANAESPRPHSGLLQGITPNLANRK